MDQPATTPSSGSVLHQSIPKISLTIGYYIAFIPLGLISASLGPALPDLAENTRASLSSISLLFTTYSLGYMLGSLLGGRLYDLAPGHRIMLAGLAAMAILAASVPLIPWLWLLATVWLLLGAAMGAVDVGGNTLLIWTHRRQVGPFMNGLHFFFGVGALLAPSVIGQVDSLSGDPTWAYWVLAILVLPAIAWLLRLPSPTSQSHSEDSPAGPARPLLVGLLVVFFFFHVAAEGSYGGWIFTYAVAMDLSSRAGAYSLTSAFWGSFTLGRLLAIPIAARLRPRVVLFGNLIGSLLSMAVILVWPHSLTATWLGTLGLGLSLASMFPTTFALAQHNMAITGRVSGLFLVGASLGGMSMPWLIGQLFERVGPHVTMWIITANIAAAVVVLAAIILYLRRSPL
jgi:FHS family Na+ dependent glucose MFS transporter 1